MRRTVNAFPEYDRENSAREWPARLGNAAANSRNVMD